MPAICEGTHGGQEGINSPGATVLGGCEPPDVGVGIQAQVLQEGRKCSTTEPSLHAYVVNLDRQLDQTEKCL